jgi:hypothetical protein
MCRLGGGHLCYPGLFKTDVRAGVVGERPYVTPLTEGKDVIMELVAC